MDKKVAAIFNLNTEIDMKKTMLMTLAAFAVLAMTGCVQSHSVSLFNGKDLDGWTIYLKDADIDPAAVWSVNNGVIHCTGKPNGYIRTKETYSNYQLHVEWRWVNEPSNSGVLLHAAGDNKLWPLCVEAQLQHQHAGDFVTIQPGSAITVNGTRYVSTPDKAFHIIAKQHDSTENTPGRWNSYDITCREGTIELYVNGTLQNTATDSALTAGAICLQSEGAPIEFRNITITPLR
jgi:hypothetical protein